jgi:hypothetical protein
VVNNVVFTGHCETSLWEGIDVHTLKLVESLCHCYRKFHDNMKEKGGKHWKLIYCVFGGSDSTEPGTVYRRSEEGK